MVGSSEGEQTLTIYCKKQCQNKLEWTGWLLSPQKPHEIPILSKLYEQSFWDQTVEAG